MNPRVVVVFMLAGAEFLFTVKASGKAPSR